MGGIGPEESNGCGLSCGTPKSGGKLKDLPHGRGSKV